MTDEDQQLVHLCGLVHDIGKIGLASGSAGETRAHSRLTSVERCRSHSEIGERILSNVDTYSEIAAVVRHHHERIDGEGYPDGLEGEEIPLISTNHRGRRRLQRDDVRPTLP